MGRMVCRPGWRGWMACRGSPRGTRSAGPSCRGWAGGWPPPCRRWCPWRRPPWAPSPAAAETPPSRRISRRRHLASCNIKLVSSFILQLKLIKSSFFELTFTLKTWCLLSISKLIQISSFVMCFFNRGQEILCIIIFFVNKILSTKSLK